MESKNHACSGAGHRNHSTFSLDVDCYTLFTMVIKRNSPVYLQMLRRMTPEQRLQKSFELAEFAKELFVQGLRKRFPNASQEEFQTILKDRLAKCHNRNY